MRFVAAAVLLGLAGPAAAQGSKEVWPELDILWRQAAHQRNFFELSSSTDHEGVKHEASVGVYQDYLFLPRGFLRAGYRAPFSTRDASYRESRIVAEATLGRSLPFELRAINRFRVEPRWVNSEYSYRVRDRIQLERELKPGIKRKLLGPYGTFEAYYDSRYNTVSRLGGRIGNNMRFGGPASLDLYLARQVNSRGSLKSVDALGIKLQLSY